MNHVERFRAVMSLQPIGRSHGEGLPAALTGEYLCLDDFKQFWFSIT
jgi:hypothetical protein